MQALRLSGGKLLAIFAVCTLALSGCGPRDPNQQVIGAWSGDSSAMSVAMKAAKLKSDYPEMDGSEAMKAARALASIALELKADKSCDMYAGGNVLHGTWKLDAEANIVELDLKTADIAPENEEKNPDGFKPQSWTCVLDSGSEKLQLYQMDRETFDSVKKAMDKEGKKLPRLFVLRKD